MHAPRRRGGMTWQVEAAWSSLVDGEDDGEVAVRAFNDIVSKGSLRTLKDREWLGDEVLALGMSCHDPFAILSSLLSSSEM